MKIFIGFKLNLKKKLREVSDISFIDNIILILFLMKNNVFCSEEYERLKAEEKHV